MSSFGCRNNCQRKEFFWCRPEVRQFCAVSYWHTDDIPFHIHSHPGFECTIVEGVDTLSYVKELDAPPTVLSVYAGTCCAWTSIDQNMPFFIFVVVVMGIFTRCRKWKRTRWMVRVDFSLLRLAGCENIFPGVCFLIHLFPIVFSRVRKIRELISHCFAMAQKPLCTGWLKKCPVKKDCSPIIEGRKSSAHREGLWRRRYINI